MRAFRDTFHISTSLDSIYTDRASVTAVLIHLARRQNLDAAWLPFWRHKQKGDCHKGGQEKDCREGPEIGNGQVSREDRPLKCI